MIDFQSTLGKDKSLLYILVTFPLQFSQNKNALEGWFLGSKIRF